MEALPEFWRPEIWHPLTVHLPLVALLLATLFKCVELFYTKKGWKLAGSTLLILGVIGVWGAIYTGNLADAGVSRNICDPTVLKAHENAAYTAAYIFTTALLFDVFSYFNLLVLGPKISFIITVVLLVTGSYFLIQTGHKGAQLVYQQGAGVYRPSESCSEFE